MAKDRADEARRRKADYVEGKMKELEILRARFDCLMNDHTKALVEKIALGDTIKELKFRLWILPIIVGLISLMVGNMAGISLKSPKPVSNSLPAPNEPVIVFTPTSFHKAYMDENKHFHQYEDGSIIPTVTHYQVVTP